MWSVAKGGHLLTVLVFLELSVLGLADVLEFASHGSPLAKMLKSNSELVSIANNFMKVMKPSFLKNSVSN